MKRVAQQVRERVNYLRVSDEDGQYPERSFDYQRQVIEDRLSSVVGISATHEYVDIERGTRTDRIQYQRMLNDAGSGKFTDLCIYRIDRLGRSPREVFRAIDLLESSGVRIWVADMPNLEIGTPTGNLQLGIQTVLAKYEIDLLGQRVRDTKRQLMLQGKWPNHPPDGYVSKREEISSRKYRCWIEPHPVQSRMVRDAYDLWLTEQYTLQQICEELHRQGYTRRSGKALVWDSPTTGSRKYAGSHIQRVLSSPFHAGWVVSAAHGIRRGQIKGTWTPIITDDELDQSLAILKEHAGDKARTKRYVYIMRGILWLKYEGNQYRMHGSTPTGRSKSYGYYETREKCGGKHRRVRSSLIESNFAKWLVHIGIIPEKLPIIRSLYNKHIDQINKNSQKRDLERSKKRVLDLETQEADLGRLLLTGEIGHDAYEKLRREWQEKLVAARHDFNNLNRDVASYLDDLEVALRLLVQVSKLFERLSVRQQSTLVRILVKRIVINQRGEFLTAELNAPFDYLNGLADASGRDSHRDPKTGPSTTKPAPDPDQFSVAASFPQRSRLQDLGNEFDSDLI